MEERRIEKLKAAVCRLAKNTAMWSVGRSIPHFFYEPKLPEALKKQTQK